jgi:hypothetical protein
MNTHSNNERKRTKSILKRTTRPCSLRRQFFHCTFFNLLVSDGVEFRTLLKYWKKWSYTIVCGDLAMFRWVFGRSLNNMFFSTNSISERNIHKRKYTFCVFLKAKSPAQRESTNYNNLVLSLARTLSTCTPLCRKLWFKLYYCVNSHFWKI